jgi:hypothetical protein
MLTITESPSRAPDGRVVWRHLAVLLLLCVLTAVMVSSLVRDPAHLTVGLEGDNLFGIRQLWWARHALLDLHRSLYFDPESGYPTGHNLAHGELFPATTIPAIPLTVLWGPVVAYNVAMFLTFVLTGFGTYFWVNGLTGSGAAGVVAGIIAAFLPYRFAHVQGHLDIASTEWMPFALYAFERFLARKSLVRAAVLGLFAGLVMLSAWYYAYGVLVILPIYALARSRPWREHWDASWWRGLGIAVLVAATMIAPFALPYLSLRLGGGLTRSLDEVNHWAINFYAFFLPNRFSPLWSGFMTQHFRQDTAEWVERGVSLGYTALGLSVFALARRQRYRGIGAVLLIWVVSYLLALGPTLHMGDHQVTVEIPATVSAVTDRLLAPLGEHARGLRHLLRPRSVPIPLPAYFMYRYVPMTSSLRVMARFGVWTGLMTAALAAWGASGILEAARRRASGRVPIAAAVALVIGGLVLAESYSPVPTTAIRPRAVDQWLAEQPHGEWAVVELPMAQARRFLQDYYKTVHQQPTLFGSPADAFPSANELHRGDVLETFPSSKALAMLRECRVRYVLFTPSEIPGWPALKTEIDRIDELTFDREIGGVLVYLVKAAPR